MLKQALAQHLDWHGARVSFLAHFILALFKVRTVNLAEIAHAFSGRAKPQSSYRRVQRFFQQFALDEVTITQLIVHLAPVGEGPWYLTLDRTNWRFGRHEINILMLGIAYRGMVVPLFWTLLPKAGNSNTAERRDLMERFLAYFGRTRIRALLADREFVGGEWLGYLQRQQIPFRIRLRHNTLIPNRWNRPVAASRLFQSLQRGEVHYLYGRRPVWGCFVFLVALRLEDGSLLLIATTDHPEHALNDYARRWDIEVLFAALKKRGFRFEDTHLTHPERLSRLTALLAIAFAWAYHTGEVLSQEQPIPFKKPSTDPSRPSFDMASISSAMSCSTSPTNLGSFSGC
jgi:hypothetical protein